MTPFAEGYMKRLQADMDFHFGRAQAWAELGKHARKSQEIALYASAHNLAWSDARDALEEQKGREYVYAETMDGRYPSDDN